MRAPGNTCLRSLHSKKMGTIADRINDSKGCGSVMRIAPCAFVTNTAIEAAKLASECGAITHGHTLALMPCFVAANMIYLNLRRRPRQSAQRLAVDESNNNAQKT